MIPGSSAKSPLSPAEQDGRHRHVQLVDQPGGDDRPNGRDSPAQHHVLGPGGLGGAANASCGLASRKRNVLGTRCSGRLSGNVRRRQEPHLWRGHVGYARRTVRTTAVVPGPLADTSRCSDGMVQARPPVPRTGYSRSPFTTRA